MTNIVYTTGQKVRFKRCGEIVTGEVAYQHPRYDAVVIDWVSDGNSISSSFSVLTKKMHCPVSMPDDPYLLD